MLVGISTQGNHACGNIDVPAGGTGAPDAIEPRCGDIVMAVSAHRRLTANVSAGTEQISLPAGSNPATGCGPGLPAWAR
jgi:hypothetical protein